MAALERGTVDLLANYDPAATLIEERGAGRIVIDARTDAGAETVYGGIYPTSVLYTTRQFLEQHPETVQKVVNATVKTLRWMDGHSAEEIYDKVPSDYVVGERASYVAAIAHAKTPFSPDGRFDPATLETPLRVLRQFNEAVAGGPDRSVPDLHQRLRRQGAGAGTRSEAEMSVQTLARIGPTPQAETDVPAVDRPPDHGLRPVHGGQGPVAAGRGW